ncbi:hypothetical protein [Chroococcidiopsis sp. CCMEE 29]|jgi:small-conductance mechanosensitive channel|uniref:hypothetical protein n=1 Tax=Chroococcidiopsis sp. CCMEE 29 TaxID=155894 RepID=UPI00202210B6|nr:hypothetical protein [Chroococcidiopsis sp. CCMEE 29]
MATESSQVVGYVPKPLYDCLEQLKNERGLHSVSQAVNAVLEDYFGLAPHQTKISQPLTQCVEDLKSEVADLKKQVAELRQNLSSNQISQLTSLKSPSKLLNQQQLAERLEVEPSVLSQHKTDGKEFTEWSRSKDPEHISWEYTESSMFRPIGSQKH